MRLVVVGAGTMGSGIGYSSVKGGNEGGVVEQDKKLLEQGMKRIYDYVDKGVSKGIIDSNAAAKMKSRLRGTVDFPEACRNAEIILEAVFEDPRVKEQVFATLDKASPPETIIASNTSSISITKLASATKRHATVLGLHFFNPVPPMELVEVLKVDRTPVETLSDGTEYVR